MDDEFVTIGRLHDEMLARIVKDLLEEEGIPVLLPGIEHRGMLGYAGAFLEIPVQVPKSRADEATTLLRAIEDAHVEEGALGAPMPLDPSLQAPAPRGPGSPYREPPAATDDLVRRRRKSVAAFTALVLGFGTGHFYAQDSRQGLYLALVEALGWLMSCAGSPFALVAVALCRLVDVFGSSRRVARENDGRQPTPVDAALKLAAMIPSLVVIALVLLWAHERLASLGAR
jgi:hypothetical protein